MTARLCTDCSRPVSAKNKLGVCRPCNCRRMGRDPAIRARTAAKMRLVWADPNYHAKLSSRLSAAKRRKMREEPEYAEMMRQRGSALGNSGLGHLAQDNEEFRRNLGRAVSNARMAWCPPAYRELYYELKRKKIGAVEARRVILEQVAKDKEAERAYSRTFEGQMETLRRGGALVEAWRPPASNSSVSMIGNSAAMAAEA